MRDANRPWGVGRAKVARDAFHRCARSRRRKVDQSQGELGDVEEAPGSVALETLQHGCLEGRGHVRSRFAKRRSRLRRHLEDDLG
jgi:hypothetical protein